MITRVAARRAVGCRSGLIDELNARAEAPVAAVAEAVDDGLRVRAGAGTEDRTQAAVGADAADGFGDDDDIGVRAPQEQVRIRADLLDRLVNYAGEVAIYRARLEQQLGAFRGNLRRTGADHHRVCATSCAASTSETEAQIIARYQREGADTATRPSIRWNSTASPPCSSCRARWPSPRPTWSACRARWTT